MNFVPRKLTHSQAMERTPSDINSPLIVSLRSVLVSDLLQTFSSDYLLMVNITLNKNMVRALLNNNNNSKIFKM